MGSPSREPVRIEGLKLRTEPSPLSDTSDKLEAAVAGFAHVVAGSVDAGFLVFSDQAHVSDYLWRFLAPTLMGNIIGGTALVAVLNYGQVATEVEA